ncbi:MAG: anthranilate synthase component I [Acidobacteria bacterium]|nr:MAG: anthranilate synthase component I [Acidobacteriota bacterium]
MNDYDVIPVVRELSADTLTPLVAFAALSGGENVEAFLFESIERGENVGRYSFIGFQPRRNLRIDATTANPVQLLNGELVPLRVKGEDQLPPFFGGAVGFFGYGAGGWVEDIPDTHPNHHGIPDAKLLFFDNVVVFDHVMQRLYIVANVFTKEDTIEDAERRLESAVEKLRNANVDPISFPHNTPAATFTSNFTRDAFEQMVRDAKEEIVAGEIFQIVVSQRWETDFPTNQSLTLYRALRSINPSPYMFLLRTHECTLVGASPEMMVRVTGDVVENRPIAGTRPRGRTFEEDAALEQALKDDPKENAEHLMLVDLGRNDLGRVCRSGSIEVSDFKHIERYSHVMHLVTNVRGKLRDDSTPFDAFIACFPAGTVSGAPKIRAMELIDRFETVRRGPYAGAVAYFSFNGNLDSCITIRTITLVNDRAYVQAGAGIVYDSDPATEFEESENKSTALKRAISVAREVLSSR